MSKNKVKQSETVEILRSQIKKADYNPRKITPAAYKALKANIKENGLIGGLVFNEQTGTLVSGHQRLTVADEINRYNPETGENDYPVKVEQISVDEKKEKELNLFFNSRATQGEYDYAKLALMLPDIDTALAGLDEVDLSMIEVEVPGAFDFEVPEFNPQIEKKIEAEIERGDHDDQDDEISDSAHDEDAEPESTERELTPEEKKAKIKEIKEQVKQGAVYEGEPYFTVSFDTYENKAFFLEMFSIGAEARFIKGEELHEILNELLEQN